MGSPKPRIGNLSIVLIKSGVLSFVGVGIVLPSTTGAVVSVVVLSVVVEVVAEPSSLLHEIMVRLKRNIEKMMSICLTRFPISGLGEPKLYQNMWCFTRIGDSTWRFSDSVKN